MRGAHRRSTQEKGAGDADARKSTTNGASRAINAVTASSAIAQAGSTGGTLGKTDKSASGGEEIDSSVARKGHPATSVTLIKTEGEWADIAKDGTVLGYVLQRQLAPLN